MADDVIARLEALLSEARDAAAFREGVCDALAACKAIHSAIDGGVEAEAEHLELLTLRRDLASTKVELAEAASARDALQGELKAMQAQRTPSGSWLRR